MSVRSTRLAKALRAGEVDGRKRKRLSFTEREACRIVDLVFNNDIALDVLAYELRFQKEKRR